MSVQSIRVFVRGRGTHVFYKTGEITNPGRGYFVDRSFPSVAEAQGYCRAELAKNRRGILYLMDGDRVVETFLDKESQRQQEVKRTILQGLLSTVPIGLAAALLVKQAISLPPSAHLPVTVATILIYVVILWCHRGAIFEAYVAMAVVFLCVVMLIPGLNKAHLRRQKHEAATAALTFYEVRRPKLAASGNGAILCDGRHHWRAVLEPHRWALREATSGGAVSL